MSIGDTIKDLNNAIERDQLFLARDLLEVLDKKNDKKAVKDFMKLEEEKIKTLRENIDTTEELLATLEDKESWKQCAKKDETTIYFMKKDDNPLIYTKLETFFEAEPDEVCGLFTKIMALFNETDLMPDWYPRGIMRSCDLIQQITKFSKTVRTRVSMPKPINLLLSPRESYLFGCGWDMSERSQVVITVTTLEEGEDVNGEETPGVSQGYAPFILQSAYYFELSDKGIIFKLMQSMNLCSKMIPAPVMNFASKGVLPFEMLVNMKKRIEDFRGSKWERRIAQNPGVYHEIEGRLATVLETRYGIKPQPLKVKLNSFDGMSTTMSVMSGNGKKKKKGPLSAISRGLGRVRARSRARSRAKSGSGKKFSRQARRSYNNLDKVDLYDYKITAKKTKLQEVTEVDAQADDRAPVQPKGLLQLFIYYLVVLLVKLFTLAGKKQRLAQLQPKISQRYPALFE